MREPTFGHRVHLMSSLAAVLAVLALPYAARAQDLRTDDPPEQGASNAEAAHEDPDDGGGRGGRVSKDKAKLA